MRFVKQTQRLRKHIIQSIKKSLRHFSDLPDGIYLMRTEYKHCYGTRYAFKIVEGNIEFVIYSKGIVVCNIDPKHLPLEDIAAIADELLELRNLKKGVKNEEQHKGQV